MNKQRENVYTLRRELLDGQIKIDEEEAVDTRGYVMTLAEELVDGPRRDAREQGAGPGGVGSRRARDARPPTCSASSRRRLDALKLDETDAGRDAASDPAALATARYEEKEKILGARSVDPPPRRARHHAADRRRAVEGPPLQPRPSEGRHRAARLRPARSARRVQERELHAVPGDEGPHRRRDGPVPVARCGRS